MLGLWERLYGLAMYSGGLMDWRNSGHPELTDGDRLFSLDVRLRSSLSTREIPSISTRGNVGPPGT